MKKIGVLFFIGMIFSINIAKAQRFTPAMATFTCQNVDDKTALLPRSISLSLITLYEEPMPRKILEKSISPRCVEAAKESCHLYLYGKRLLKNAYLQIFSDLVRLTQFPNPKVENLTCSLLPPKFPLFDPSKEYQTFTELEMKKKYEFNPSLQPIPVTAPGYTWPSTITSSGIYTNPNHLRSIPTTVTPGLMEQMMRDREFLQNLKLSVTGIALLTLALIALGGGTYGSAGTATPILIPAGMVTIIAIYLNFGVLTPDQRIKVESMKSSYSSYSKIDSRKMNIKIHEIDPNHQIITMDGNEIGIAKNGTNVSSEVLKVNSDENSILNLEKGTKIQMNQDDGTWVKTSPTSSSPPLCGHLEEGNIIPDGGC